jgi:hypothetical protein
MSEPISEALKGILEGLIEWKNAPKETEELFRLFAGSGDRVLYESRAGYINSKKMFDRPAGILLITNTHMLFLANPNKTPVTKTKWVKIPIRSITDAHLVKYRAGYKIAIMSGDREYSFMLQNQIWFKSKEEHEAAAQILVNAALALEDK